MVPMNAVESYVRSIAMENRDIQATLAQTEQLPAEIDSEVK